ncbi:MAG: DUF177 domain-containing protein [Candidatus Omnitrophica bacterium]|nr:DUF177 domain-containing protein [Candidatus Omnitrophota bacterium]
MKVAVNKIPQEGLLLEEDVSAQSWDMDSFDIKFVDNIHMVCEFSKVGKNILVKTEVTTYRIITCSRCLQEVGQKVVQKFDFCYSISHLGDYLEMDEAIREQILLEFPMKVLCRPDCKGLCPRCGVNLNYSQCQCVKKSN